MIRRRRQYRYLLPNTLTGLTLFLGLWAIMLVIDGGREALVIAAWWIVIAGLMDGLDGAVARMTNTTSKFGVQFDSLSDLTTFCVAPATLLYAVIFPWNSRVAVGVAATFAIAGAVRLARFNISASQTAKKRSFQGVPVPAAAGLIAAAVLCLPGIEHLLGGEVTRRLLPMAALVTAYLMISKIRFLTFRDLVFRGDETSLTVTLQILAFVVFIYWLLFQPREVLALLIFGGYVVYSTSAALVWRLRLFRRPWEREEREAER
jgi:CDP-diacylglycerol--serine O-phosphatidyltransferase